jgi:hypothetical protein
MNAARGAMGQLWILAADSSTRSVARWVPAQSLGCIRKEANNFQAAPKAPSEG